MGIFYATFFFVLQGVPVVVQPPESVNRFSNMTECEAYMARELQPIYDYLHLKELPESTATGVCLPIDNQSKRDI
jgi:hypothetical protein